MVNNSLGGFSFKTTSGKKQVSTDGGSTWENFSSGAELLWDNPAPSSSFTSKTVSIDLSNYESVIVRCNSTDTLIPKGTSGYAMQFDSTWAFYRKTTVSNNGVTFGNGHGNNGDNPSHCIPTKIYGVGFSL